MKSTESKRIGDFVIIRYANQMIKILPIKDEYHNRANSLLLRATIDLVYMQFAQINFDTYSVVRSFGIARIDFHKRDIDKEIYDSLDNLFVLAKLSLTY
jgi:hypothetical protein